MVSDGIKNSWSFFDFCVLILIVMEHALGERVKSFDLYLDAVLILIVMEHALGVVDMVYTDEEVIMS